MLNFIGDLLGGLIQVASSIVGRVLISLGLGYVSYTGISVLLDSLKGSVVGYLSGAPVDIVGIMAVLKVDVAVSIIFSALTVRFILQGLSSGVVKKLIYK